MEIEKKYLVTRIPERLDQYDKWELEQCYLCTRPTIRIRRKNEEYILTYKNRTEDIPVSEDTPLNIAQEVELPLTEDAYCHLREKADGICIVKTRYRIPYERYTIELDLFHGEYNGFCLAEVEFDTIEEACSFVPPDWFGEDVSGSYHYTNSYLALKYS